MVDINCSKCGAKIPEGAKFCLSCGSKIEVKKKPEPTPQPQAPQQAAPAPMATPRGSSSINDIIGSIFNESLIYIMILLGLLFVSIGGLMFVYGGWGTVPTIGLVLNSLGFFFMGTFLLMGGLINKNFPEYVRFGMILGGAIMLTWSLAISA